MCVSLEYESCQLFVAGKMMIDSPGEFPLSSVANGRFIERHQNYLNSQVFLAFTM